MEEAVYIIRLTSEAGHDLPSRRSGFPSEHRYSASMIQGLGTIHFCLGLLNVLLGALALFCEVEINQYASGLWSGVIFATCGILGLLAHSKWYVKNQIFYFLIGSFLAMMAALGCIVMTSVGIEMKSMRLEQIRIQYATNPFIISHNEEAESQATCIVTINIFITSIAEFLWSLISTKFAFDGFMAVEYQMGIETASPGLMSTRSFSAWSSEAKGLSQGELKRRECHITRHLPPGLSAHAMLTNPHFLCHLTAPYDYHVTRVNPLCSEDADQDQLLSISTISQGHKVERYLSQSVPLAQENSRSSEEEERFRTSTYISVPPDERLEYPPL